MTRRHAFFQLVLTRVREFYREPEAVFWVYGFPLILAVVLGLAFSGGAPPAPDIDIQGSQSDPAVQQLVQALQAGGFKEIGIYSEDECRRRLRVGKTSLFIQPGEKERTYVYDPTRSEGVLAQKWVDDVLVRAEARPPLPAAREVIVDEPGGRYIDFLLPGLLGMNLMGGGLFGVGFVLVDMRVRKLFKRFMATPVNRRDFLLSILVSRLLFLIPEMLVLLGVGILLMGVPVNGNPLTLALVILMGALCFNGLGLLLGCRTEKTETASGLMNLIMLPMYLLSGVFFSSKRFPDEAQPFIQALPLTQVNDALREVMLEGHGLGEVAWRLGILALWGVGSFLLALRWFKWR